MRHIGHVWKAVIATGGTLATSMGALVVTAQATGHDISATAVVVAVLGALGTGLTTYAKANLPLPDGTLPDDGEHQGHAWQDADAPPAPPPAAPERWPAPRWPSLDELAQPPQ